MKISVLMTVYSKDNPLHFSQSLTSIWDYQILKPDEICLIVDGKIPNQLNNCILEFSQKCQVLNVQYLPLNIGLALALRKGVEICRYELIARMDADDIALPERFLVQSKYLKDHPEIVVLGTAISEFNELPGDLFRIKSQPSNFAELAKYARLRNPINHPSVMFRRSSILKVDSYKDMKNFEDYYLWLRIMKNGYKIENLYEVLLNFRVGNGMINRRRGFKYMQDEYHFLKTVRKENLIQYRYFLISLINRIILRILPYNVVNVVYKHFLRKTF